MIEKYIADSKEETFIQAAFNGHTNVWPMCECQIEKGVAKFYKNGKKVWQCNERYARFHFKLTPNVELIGRANDL